MIKCLEQHLAHDCSSVKTEWMNDWLFFRLYSRLVYPWVYLCCCLVTELYLILLWPHGLLTPAPTRLLWSWVFPSKHTGVEWFTISFSGDLPNPGIRPVSAALPGKFFTSELPEKPHGLNLKGIKVNTTKVLHSIGLQLKFSTESLKYEIQYSKESLCLLWQ